MCRVSVSEEVSVSVPSVSEEVSVSVPSVSEV